MALPGYSFSTPGSGPRAINIFEDRPLVGSGASTYGLQYDAYGGRNLSSNVHPHNAYLNVLVDSGLIGMGLLLAAAAVFASWFGRAYLRSGPDARVWLAACASALITLPVHGLVDSPQLWNPVMVVTAVVVIIATRVAARRRPNREPDWRLVARNGLLVALFGWLLFDLPHARYQRARNCSRPARREAAIAVRAADSFRHRQPTALMPAS
jgi:O-antigen ligase